MIKQIKVIPEYWTPLGEIKSEYICDDDHTLWNVKKCDNDIKALSANSVVELWSINGIGGTVNRVVKRDKFFTDYSEYGKFNWPYVSEEKASPRTRRKYQYIYDYHSGS